MAREWGATVKLQLERLRQRMHQEASFSTEEIENRLAELPELPQSDQLQKIWDYMFMIDLDPKNEERFGLSWKEVVGRILAVPVD